MFRDVEETLRRQTGVISRRQALSTGMQQHDIRRMLRRNEWARVHHGVYVDHTGPLTWLQRAWAAVLYAAPAALCLDSALMAADGPEQVHARRGAPIHVAVARQRAMLTEPEGVRIHHLTQFDGRVLWNVGPPRLRYEDAALDVACAATSELDAIAALADCCQSRCTTARRLLHTLDSRLRVPLEWALMDVCRSKIHHDQFHTNDKRHAVVGRGRMPRRLRQRADGDDLQGHVRGSDAGAAWQRSSTISKPARAPRCRSGRRTAAPYRRRHRA